MCNSRQLSRARCGGRQVNAGQALIGGLLMLGGCAADSQFSGDRIDPRSSATILGIGGTTGDFLAGILVPIGVQKEVLIFKVDGVKVNTWGTTNKIHLEPGKYRLTVSCRFKLDGRNSFAYEELAVDVKSGRTYQLDAEPKCHPQIRDVTDEAQ